MARRMMKWFCLMAVVVLLAAACAVGETIKSSQYGFELTIPGKAKKIVDDQDKHWTAQGYQVFNYVSGNIIYHIEANVGQKGTTASSFLAEAAKEDAEMVKASNGAWKQIELVTPQGIHAAGVSIFQERPVKHAFGDPPVKYCALADQMFKAAEYDVQCTVPLDENECKILTITLWGAGDQKASVDKAAKTLVESIRLSKPEKARPAQAKTAEPSVPAK